MERTTANRPTPTDSHHTQTDDADPDERDIPHFESLTVPDLMSVPLFTAWLRRLFRRKDTAASR
jgi:hypothetical protein